MRSEKKRNFQAVRKFFGEKLANLDREGVVGVASFQDVYDELMPVQQAHLEQICGGRFNDFLKNGSVICFGMAYPEAAIDNIDTKRIDGTTDTAAWNTYAKEYNVLNRVLDVTASEISQHFGVVMIPPITGATVKKVEEYYGKTISHRVVAEHAGLGWRGKNELLVNGRLSCALRFASVVTLLPLPHGEKLGMSCQDCTACIDSCSILKNKNILQNYRENCRNYITSLGLEAGVCGKCVKACYRNSTHNQKFKLK